MNFPIYLDNNSTTRVDERVMEEMLPYFTKNYGNASSNSHSFGFEAAAAVKIAREKVASLIGADASEITFTSGTTESVNLALKGLAAHSQKGSRIITTLTEHNAVLDTCRSLERWGYAVAYLPVDKFGLVSPDDVLRAIDDNTILVSVIHANNEVGSVNDIKAIGKICEDKNTFFHVDAAQSSGKIPIDVKMMNIDLMSFSAHKMYGPKGNGALYIRKQKPRIRLMPQIEGGGHERGLRSGTLNVPGIVGFGKSCEISQVELESETKRLILLRNRLLEGILSNLEDVYLNGHPEKRLAGNLNITFRNVDSAALMRNMKEIAVSAGSACSSETVEPSHVLQAMGADKAALNSSLRFGIGRFNTEKEIDYTIGKVVESVHKLRIT